VEEEEPFPGIGGEAPEDMPFDEETSAEGEDGGETVSEKEDGESGEAENPMEENIFGEEEPEDFWETPPEEAGMPEAEESAPPEPDDQTPEEESAGETGEAEETPLPAGDSPVPVPAELEEPPAMAAPERKKEPELTKDGMLGLMNYLKNLAGALPDKDRDNFMQSEARLGMEHIITTLKGQRGLIKTVEERRTGNPPLVFSGKMAALRAAAGSGESEPRKRKNPNLPGMLAFMAKLAGALPDQTLGLAISRKLDTVLSEIKQSGANCGGKV
jgi:hypothetical protein